jgi:hypothetical protein
LLIPFFYVCLWRAALYTTVAWGHVYCTHTWRMIALAQLSFLSFGFPNEIPTTTTTTTAPLSFVYVLHVYWAEIRCRFAASS